jgi:UDP-N-acetylglucosamine 2-epimerase (non-hydrolysing)
MKLIHLIAAARPNFMKIAPLYHALKQEDWVEPVIVHTGQHYDKNMSETFFTDLKLPKPHIHLGIGSGTHAEQTGKVMMAYEKVIIEKRPNLVVVVGDVNSTLACALASVKLNIPVAHLEAGLRSFDRTMPEEINRVLTDAIAHILWTPSQDGDDNLFREGISEEKIQRVGNIMIDSLEMMRDSIEEINTYSDFGLSDGNYALITLHRPSNVDKKDKLKKLCKSLVYVASRIQVIFPVHPRTYENLKAFDLFPLLRKSPNLRITNPMNYLSFMNLLFHCKLAITDSGGIQEETTYLGIPCLTLRPNTERPITIKQGTNKLCKPENIEENVDAVLNGKQKTCKVPELWDGHTAGRIVESIEHFFDN